MNADALPDLPTAEGTNVAFLPTPDSGAAARAVAAFLNGSGGLVMIGYDAEGAFVGLRAHPEVAIGAVRQEIEHAVLPREPLQITPVEKDGLVAMLVEVPSGTRKPYLVDGTIYVRRGGATQTASPAEISRVVARRGRAEQRWERQPALDLVADEALNAPLIQETYRRAVERLDVPVAPDNRPLSFLESLGLAAEGYPTRAALALFAQPQAVPRYLPQARAQLLSFEDESVEKPVGRRELAGGAAVLAEPLFEAAAVTLPRILRLTEGVQRDERLAIPAPALREVLVNALAHRDYTDSASVSVRFFPGRVEVWNPGRMDQAFLADDGARLVSRPTNPGRGRAPSTFWATPRAPASASGEFARRWPERACRPRSGGTRPAASCLRSGLPTLRKDAPSLSPRGSRTSSRRPGRARRSPAPSTTTPSPQRCRTGRQATTSRSSSTRASSVRSGPGGSRPTSAQRRTPIHPEGQWRISRKGIGNASKSITRLGRVEPLSYVQ